jgi:hypothetical protein
MRKAKYCFLALAAALLLTAGAPTHAQVAVGVQIGPEPVCPYGYYNFAPYNCAPYGYYGPEWFASGVFIGVGPWFHGPHGFHGYIDNRYDPHHGYRGPYPEHNDQRFNHFHGNESRDEHGNVYREHR